MTKQYIIKDLQTGDFSHYTELDDIFEDLTRDYLSNNWTEEEAERLKKEFKEYTEAEKIDFVQDEYDYKLIEFPTPKQVREWESFKRRVWVENKEPDRVFIIQVLHVRDKGREHTWGIEGVFHDRKKANDEAIKVRDGHIKEWYISKNKDSYEIYEHETGLYTGSVEGEDSSFSISVTAEYCK